LKNTYDLSNWEHFLPQNLRGGLRPSLNLSGGGECPPAPPPVSAPDLIGVIEERSLVILLYFEHVCKTNLIVL